MSELRALSMLRSRAATAVVCSVLVVASLIALLPTVTWWNDSLDSDVLYLKSFYDDLFVRHLDVSHFQLPPAPFLMPDLPLFFAAYATLPDIGFTFAAFAVSITLLFAAGVVVLVRAADAPWRDALLAGSLAVAAVVAVVVTSGLTADSTLMPTVHGGTTMLEWVLFAFSVRPLLDGWTRRRAAILLVTLTLLVASDRITGVQLLAPLVLAAAVSVYRGAVSRKNALVTAALCAAGALLGEVLVVVVTALHVLDIAPLGASGTFDVGYFHRMWLLFSRESLPYLLIVIGLVGTFGWAAWQDAARGKVAVEGGLDRRHRVVTVALAFTVLQALVTTLAPIVASQWVDDRSMRYLRPLYFTPPLVVIAVLALSHRSVFVWSRRAFTALALIVMVGSSIDDVTGSATLDPTLPYSQAHQCLDGIVRGFAIHTGYAEYWVARHTEIYTRSGVRLLAVSPDTLDDYPWMGNPKWYEGAPRPGGSEAVLFLGKRLDKEKIVAKFGEPTVRYRCRELGTVLVYDRARPAP